MNLTQLNDEIKVSMKSQDKVRLAILRQVLNEVRNIEVNEQREATEQDIDAMLKRTLKQTNETLEASIKAANDDDRTKTLQAQCAILEEYMPKQVSGAELESLVAEVISSTGASTMKDMGNVMKELGAKTGGNFDKGAAAGLVKAALS